VASLSLGFSLVVTRNGIAHVSEVALHQAVLILGWVTVRGIASWYLTGHRGLLSLPIPLWVGAVSTGDGLGNHWGRNDEFCVTVGPVTRTAGILAQSVKGAGHPDNMGCMLA